MAGLDAAGFCLCHRLPILGSKGIDARHLIMEARPRNYFTMALRAVGGRENAADWL